MRNHPSFGSRSFQTLVDLFYDQRDDATLAAIIVDQGAKFGALELVRRCSALLTGLRRLGAAPGDRIMLHLPNGWEWIVSYFAILGTGAIVVPCNVMLSDEELAFVARDCGAKMLITSQTRAIGDMRQILTAGESEFAFHELLKSELSDNIRPDPDSMATINYTSGTTGFPKGVMLSHRAILASTWATATMHVRQPGEVILSALPFTHVYGNVVLNTALLVGMTLVIHPRFEAVAALRAIEEHRVTLFEGVPTMYHYMLADPNLEKLDLSSLRRCTVGGQTMPLSKLEAVERRFGCPVLELWGMTELAGPAVTHSPYAPAQLGTIGVPMPGTEVKIVDLHDPNVVVKTGEVGELVVRSNSCMIGYYQNSIATAEALSEDGWLKTGDLGFRDDQGQVSIVDRRKDMIITAGYNVYPAELERVISEHPSVGMVAVAGLSDPVKGEVAKAFVVLKPGEAGDSEAILQHCRERLAPYKIPRIVEFVKSLPTTSTGKILRRELVRGR